VSLKLAQLKSTKINRAKNFFERTRRIAKNLYFLFFKKKKKKVPFNVFAQFLFYKIMKRQCETGLQKYS
jgi:hypothetical protein